MARDITLRATYSDLTGDETYELWLKHETDAWALEQAGDVDPDENMQQLLLILTLIEGDDYVAQIRLKREGRYRAGYLTSNPDTWPESSRCEFTPGALVGADAPVVNSATWSRTSSVSQKIQVSVNADDLDIDLRIFRNGVSIGVVPAPHVNPVLFDDVDPPLAEEHDYTAKHTAGFLDGPVSNTVSVFAGPAVPDAVDVTTDDTDFGFYTIEWDADGDNVRLQDDFACEGVYVTQYFGATTPHDRNLEDHVIPIGGTMLATFHARVRREVDSFSVTDVSDWVEVLVEILIEDTNTEYFSCP